MGIGRAGGDSRALDATRQAIASPLLEININGAQGILFNIAGSANLSLFEVTEAAEEIRSVADPEANIIFGTSFDERLGDEVIITVIATGFDSTRKHDAARREPNTLQAPVPVHVQRPETTDFLQEFERQRRESTEVAPRRYQSVHSSAGGERQSVPVPVQAPLPPRPSMDQSSIRHKYDEENLEIPSFLRRRDLEDRD